MGVLILGAGGHGKVVADILQLQGVTVTGFLDDNSDIWGTRCLDLPVLGAIGQYAEFKPEGLVLGIGSNQTRKKLVERLGQNAQPLWINAIHPTATVARSVRLGRGVVLAAHTVVNPDTQVGDHVIVNTAATIDHDCIIGDYGHIAPGVHMAGGVQVGEGVLMGIGSTSLPGCSIADWAVVGAGACVTQSITENGITVVGVPAKPLQKSK